MNSQFKAVIWDMDGVLVDNSDIHFQVWQEIYRDVTNGAYEFQRSTFESIFGMRNDRAIMRVLGSEVATPAFVAEISEVKERLFRERIRGAIEPSPGVTKWLSTFQARGIRQAVASSATLENIHAILTEIGLCDYFELLLSGDSAGIVHGKPAPDIFLEAARQLGVQPASCLVIEDAIVGVQAANDAGMHCLAVMTTYSAQDLGGADWVVADFNSLSPEELMTMWSSSEN